MPAEYRLVWNTPGGGTGYSVFHFGSPVNQAGANSIAAATHNFADSLKAAFPNEVTIEGDTEVLDMGLDGTLLAAYPVAPGTLIAGLSPDVYNRAAGLRIDWGTDVIVAGRRLSGRTYLIPGAASVYDSQGQINAATQAAVALSGTNFIAATAGPNALSVWSRTHSALGTVRKVSVPSQGAILRGRRN